MHLEAFLDKMTWMKAVSEKGIMLGPEPWHMHPIVFLKAVGTSDGVTYTQLKTIFHKLLMIIQLQSLLNYKGGWRSLS